MPSNHNCLNVKVYPVKSFFSHSKGDKRGQWRNRNSLCVCVCLLPLGRFFFSFLWAEINLYIGTFSRFQLLVTVCCWLATGRIIIYCVFALVSGSFARLLILAVFLYQSGETRARAGYSEMEKGFPCSGWSLAIYSPKEKSDKAICYYLSWGVNAVVFSWLNACYHCANSSIALYLLPPACIHVACTLPHVDPFLFFFVFHSPAISEVWKSKIRGPLKAESNMKPTFTHPQSSWIGSSEHLQFCSRALSTQAASHSELAGWRCLCKADSSLLDPRRKPRD